MNKRFATALVVSTALLGGGVLANLFLGGLVSAEGNTSSTKRAGVNVKVTSFLALSVGVNIEDFDGDLLFDDVMLSPDGEFRYQPLAARVFTTPNIGYQLTLSDSNSDTSMRHEDVSVDSKIESITSGITTGKTGNNFPVNKWAYAQGNLSELDSIDFLPIPALSTPDVIGYRNEPNSSGYDDDYITIAIKPGGMLTAGTYSDILQFTASAVLQPEFDPDPSAAPAFYKITTMQKMTEEVCASVPTPSRTATTRITFSEGMDTGLLTGVDGEYGYIPYTVLEDTRDNKQYGVVKLADGNCWMAENLKFVPVASETYTSDDTDVTSWTVPTGIKTTLGASWGENDGTIAVVTGNPTVAYTNEYYYTWFAATAGTGATTMKSTSFTNLTDAPSSICPAGWRLPQGGRATSGTGNDKSFYSLFSAYGNSLTEDNYFIKGNSYIIGEPFNFPIAGLYHFVSGALFFDADEYAYYWSSSAATYQGNAFILYSRKSAVYPGTTGSSKGYGHSIRCVAR